MEQYFTVKKLLLALALWLVPVGAWAQCTGVFPANTLCGNLSGSPQPPAAFSSAGTIAGPATSIVGGVPAWANTLGTQITSTAAAYTFYPQTTTSTSQPEVILYNSSGTSGSGEGLLFNSNNSSGSSLTAAYVNCGLIDATSSIERGLCDYSVYDGTNAKNRIIVQTVNAGAASGNFAPADDNYWSLGTTALAWLNEYTHALTVLGPATGSGAIIIGNPDGTHNAETVYTSGGASIWETGKDGGGNFFIFSDKLGQNTFSSNTSGAITLHTPLAVGSGGTGNATATAHSVPINEGTAAQANTLAGTTGQCLTSNGASADPAYGSGCETLLATSSITSGTAILSDFTHITGTYSGYTLEIIGCVPVANDPGSLVLQVITNGAAATSNYLASSVGNTTNVTSTAAIPLELAPASGPSNANGTWGGFTGAIRLFPPVATNQQTWAGYGAYVANGGTQVLMDVSGTLSVATVVTGYQLQFGGSNMAACSTKLYGRL